MERGFTSREGATITSGKVKTIRMKCFTFSKEMRSSLEVVTFAGVTSKPGGECYLIAQEVESAKYKRDCPVLIL